MKACLFDFNGTLFFDGPIHVIIWKKTLNELTDGKLDFESFYKDHGSQRDGKIIKDACEAVHMPYDDELLTKWTDYKEEMYRTYSREHDLCHLAPGAKAFLDMLKEKGYLFNLCTSSIEANCQFYFDDFNLYRWFKWEDKVYDNGQYDDKVEMYKDAAKRLNVSMDDCYVFEDTPSGINNAIKAGCRHVIFINSSDKQAIAPEIVCEVKDYRELDPKLF